MTKINERSFADRIEEYIIDPSCFDQDLFDSSLYSVSESYQKADPASGRQEKMVQTLHGLCFSEYIELVMILLEHGFHSLSDATKIKKYSRAMSHAMQDYAEPLMDSDHACYPGPYFLLHGLDKDTLAESVAQFENNGRIIHETLAARGEFLKNYGGAVSLGNGIKMLMEEGSAEDHFGICCYVAREDEQNPHGTDSTYIAKASFFLDTLNSEIVVITMQGQRVFGDQKNRSRNYARLAAKLKMDPRGYVLKKVCEIAKGEGYKRVRVVRPEYHPMYIDSHGGFMARYEPIILQAGITRENGCYLEGVL